jgi:hypothetical protein
VCICWLLHVLRSSALSSVYPFYEVIMRDGVVLFWAELCIVCDIDQPAGM